jgi:uncharacterized DUF497 family protein
MIIWDEPKRLANLEKHGLDFSDAEAFDWSAAIVRSARNGRFQALGAIGNTLVLMIFKPLGTEAISLISLRRASAKERRAYAGHKG